MWPAGDPHFLLRVVVCAWVRAHFLVGRLAANTAARAGRQAYRNYRTGDAGGGGQGRGGGGQGGDFLADAAERDTDDDEDDFHTLDASELRSVALPHPNRSSVVWLYLVW